MKYFQISDENKYFNSKKNSVKRRDNFYSKFLKLVLATFLVLLIKYDLSAQCSVSSMFTTSSFLGSTPKTVTFTSTSNGSPTTYDWLLNGNSISSSSSVNHTFNSSGNNTMCLVVGNGSCTSEYCIDIPIGYGAGCDPTCEPVNNFDYEIIFNPSAPGTIGSSNNFDSDVCGWQKAQSTPYYCYYATNSYIAIRLAREHVFFGPPERASTTIPLKNLVNGKQYEICWKYSIQQQFNIPPNIVSYIPESPDAIYVEKNNSIGTAPTAIRTIAFPEIDEPSSAGSILAPLDYDCFSPEDIEWHTDCFTFTFDSNKPYLSISGSNPGSLDFDYHIPYLFVDFVKISCPPTCAEPPIFTTSTTGCGASFTLVNQPVYGTITWDYGDGFTGSLASHTYLYPGIFEVCATLTCEDGTKSTFCKKVTISSEECSDSCTTLSTVTAVKLCGDENPYLGNVTIDIPKGYAACNDTPVLTTTNSTAGVSLNSFLVTSASSSSDKISLSFNVIPLNGSSFPSSNTNFSFSLCDKNGNSICFIVPVNGNQCTNCITEVLTAECDEESSYPGNYVYSGALPNGINGIPLSSVAGFTNSSSTFQITSSQPLPTGPIIIIGYTDLGTSINCTKYIINIVPCDPLPTECVAFWNPKVFFCEGIDRNTGEATFKIPNMTIPLTQNGITYSICNGVLGADIEGGGNVEINNASSSGSNLNFDITISMSAGSYNGELYEMRLYLCDPDGNVVCFLFKLMLFCDEESEGRVRLVMIENEDILIFPNPATDYISFQLHDKELSILNISIFDQMSNIVFTDNAFSSIYNFNSSSLPAGVYVCYIKDSLNYTYIRKFVIQH